MYAAVATATAELIHNPGIQARAVLNSVFVDVTPEDDRIVKIAFVDAPEQGHIRVDFILLDARKAHLDTVTGTFPAGQAAGQVHRALFDVIDAWCPPVS
ncbi:hypothetical protein [Kitasatospora purpeofusca]|uniref:hypothetical protein n=1 Tax=Kitasatospora purpeofusca TaxID=67352 RepID=UPI002A59A52A|nr:hypothetical protein [Kitasatospora purpeofusca]MDY0811415.1 hypothetical protein [Kitasatospora purpeofusca]